MRALVPAGERASLQQLMSERHPVATVGEIPAGGRKLFTIGALRGGLFHLENGGGFRAYQDFCPHAGAPLCAGPLHPGPDGRPALRCPWHGWEFDLDTGYYLWNPRCRLDSFPVEVEGDTVYVRLDVGA